MDMSILTAVDLSRADHLDATAASVSSALRLLERRGLAGEWVLTVDGTDHLPNVPPPAQSEILPWSIGVSGARSHALANARGKWIYPLDADDLVSPEGLCHIVSYAAESTYEGWIASSRRLLDGTSTAHTLHHSSCWKVGALDDERTSPFPFHPNPLLVKRAIALASPGYSRV